MSGATRGAARRRVAVTVVAMVLAAATVSPRASSAKAPGAPGAAPAPQAPKRQGAEGRKVQSRRMVGPSAAKDDATLTLLPAPTSPLVTFRIQFAVGAIDDPEGMEGLSALTAMTIGSGGTRELSYREVVDRLYPMAATFHVQPDREVTTFIGEVHKDHVQDLYGIITGLLLTPRFDEADFRRNRDLLVAAIENNLRASDEEELGKEALNASIFAGHPYGRPVVGLVSALKTISIDNVKAFYAQHYTRKDLVIGLAGGYPPLLPQAMREEFRLLPADGAARHELPPPPKIEGLEVTMVEKPTPTAAISIGAPLDVTRADHDFYALLLASSYLGEHRTFNGRLMNDMRAARGLNYGDYSYVETFIQDGGSTFPLTNIPRHQQTFTIWIRPVARDNAAFAVRQALRELHRLVDQGMTKAELDATRAFLLNYSRLWAQSQSRRLGYLMDSGFYGIPSYLDRVQEILPTLTLDQVNAAIRKHLDAANLKIAIVAYGARGILQQLTSDAPTPIVYQTPTTDPALVAEDKEIAVYPLKVNGARVRILPAATMFEE